MDLRESAFTFLSADRWMGGYSESREYIQWTAKTAQIWYVFSGG